MDFFQHQDRARRQTHFLLLYFLLAVVGVVFVLNFAFFLPAQYWGWVPDFATWWQLPKVQLYSVILLAAMLFVTLKRIYQLSHGIEQLAALLGAFEVPSNTTCRDERRLLNVVEEMSIATGLAVPTVYVLAQERSINAFVAGYQPADSILVVTRGLLEKLSRDEMQAVVAHEFSHILHGDMRLNLRLVGVLAGIFFIYESGVALLTAGTYKPKHSRHELTGGRHLDGLIISPFSWPIALVFIIIGSVGLLLGRMIKTAISRQREFLADASAVQFTRNRAALISALLKIRGDKHGGFLYTPYAEEVSHMCFAESVSGVVERYFAGLTASHPSLSTRIIQLDPSYKHRLKWRDRAQQRAATDPNSVPAFPEKAALLASKYADKHAPKIMPMPEHLAYAKALYQRIPNSVLQAVHQPETATYVIYALLWQGNEAERAARRDLLQMQLGNEATEACAALQTPIHELGLEAWLPLIDLATPALKRLHYAQRQTFLNLVEALIKADKRVSVLEFVLSTILRQHLAPAVDHLKKPIQALNPVLSELSLLFALLAQLGGGQSAYQQGLSELTHDVPPLPSLKRSARDLQQALQRLQQLTPLLKKQVLDACAVCVLADQQVKPKELAVLRAIAEALDCPLPPMVIA